MKPGSCFTSNGKNVDQYRLGKEEGKMRKRTVESH